jgi:hypothetical protein
MQQAVLGGVQDHLVEALVHKASEHSCLYLGDLGDRIILRLLDARRRLAKLLSRLTLVPNLWLSFNGVVRGNTMHRGVLVPVLQAALPTLTNLLGLDLSCNNLGYLGGKGLDALGQKGADNREYMHRMVGAMASITTNLRKLDLSGNSIGTMGMQALGLASFTKLRDLKLSGNLLGGVGEIGGVGGVAPGARILAEALPPMARLRSLHLNHNQLGEDAMRLLAPALASLKHLWHLNLKNNQLKAEGVAMLQGVLPSLPALRELDLRQNQLGAGVPLVARAIPFMTDLTVLRLSFNDFGADGLQALSEPLLLLTKIRELHLDAPDSPTLVNWEVAVGLDIQDYVLQRGWRVTLRVVWHTWKVRRRQVAFAMGAEERLGEYSIVRCLDAEMVRMVSRQQ